MSTFASTMIELSKLDDARLKEEVDKLDHETFRKAKDMPESIAERVYKQAFKQRWDDLEKRIKIIENRMQALNPPERSVAEDRFDILAELLDKSCQSFEIYDEHEKRKVPFSHRLVLEAMLLQVTKEGFDMIENTLDRFGEMGEDRDAANYERQELRFEIRFRDLIYTEVHEKFLKSYLDMDW